jgi:hypothetical protein
MLMKIQTVSYPFLVALTQDISKMFMYGLFTSIDPISEFDNLQAKTSLDFSIRVGNFYGPFASELTPTDVNECASRCSLQLSDVDRSFDVADLITSSVCAYLAPHRHALACGPSSLYWVLGEIQVHCTI